MRLINFEINEEDFGLDISEVREILPFSGCVPIPGSHPDLEGIVRVRNQLVPVINLRRKLNLPVTQPGKSARIIIVDTTEGAVGLLVDRVKNVIPLSDDRLAEVPNLLRRFKINYLNALGELDDTIMIVITTGRLFGDYRLDEVIAPAQMSIEQFESRTTAQPDAVAPPEIAVIAAPDTSWTCAQCGKQYRSGSALKRHQKKNHAVETH